jgi:hypothetical protein
MYKKLAGMTGTAVPKRKSFYRIYGLDVLGDPLEPGIQGSTGDSGLKAEETKDQEGYKYTILLEDSDSSQTPLFTNEKTTRSDLPHYRRQDPRHVMEK